MKINFKKKFKTYWQGLLGMFSEISFVVFLLVFWLGLTYLLMQVIFK